MNELVVLKKNDCFTTSRVIAEGTSVKHRSIQRTIEKHLKRIERFGKVRFKITPSPSGQNQKVYFLNEEQATFLITLLRNTDMVLSFKSELVRQFYAMRKFIMERQTEEWRATRKQGKLTRKNETDVLKQLVEYAKEQGSKSADKLYIVYSKLAKKAISVPSRDKATIMELNNLNLAENIILHCIKTGIASGKHYKEIYQDSKQRLEMFKIIAFLEEDIGVEIAV